MREYRPPFKRIDEYRCSKFIKDALKIAILPYEIFGFLLMTLLYLRDFPLWAYKEHLLLPMLRKPRECFHEYTDFRFMSIWRVIANHIKMPIAKH